jgi:Zn-dependent protease with chaperone function
MPDDVSEKSKTIDNLLLRVLLTDDYNFRFYLRECLTRLPLADLKRIVYEKNVHLLVATQNSIVSADAILYDPGKGERVLVVFTTNFSKCEPHEILYIIAHEFAHVFLSHHDKTIWKGQESEIDADRQVIEWGFEGELRRSYFNYIGANV